jgi:hypothetical protein
MVSFKTKTINLGIFWMAERKEREKVGIFYGHLVKCMPMWYNVGRTVWCSLWSFGTFFPFWYVRTKTKLATLSNTKSVPENLIPIKNVTKLKC